MDQPYEAVVNAGGRAVIKVRPDGQVGWLIQQVSIEMSTAPVGAVCTLRKNGRFITAMIPTGDAAGGDPPVPIGPADYLTVEWASCNPGDQGTALVLYDEVIR